MELTVLGCGDAFASAGRFNTSFLLTHEKESVLIDCGASTLIQLKRHRVELEQISTIIISHFHGDHYGGLPFFLISSLFEQPRRVPLTLVGPQGIEERVRALQECMYPGSTASLAQLDIHFVECGAHSTCSLHEKEMAFFPVVHSSAASPHGIRLTWAHKIIGFSGDTEWTDQLIPIANGADLFICECNFETKVSPGHLSYEELEQHAASLHSKQIWLSHMNEAMILKKDSRFRRLEDNMKIRV